MKSRINFAVIAMFILALYQRVAAQYGPIVRRKFEIEPTFNGGYLSNFLFNRQLGGFGDPSYRGSFGPFGYRDEYSDPRITGRFDAPGYPSGFGDSENADRFYAPGYSSEFGDHRNRGRFGRFYALGFPSEFSYREGFDDIEYPGGFGAVGSPVGFRYRQGLRYFGYPGILRYPDSFLDFENRGRFGDY